MNSVKREVLSVKRLIGLFALHPSRFTLHAFSLVLVQDFFVFLLEAVDAAGGIHQFLFAGEERMASRADFEIDLFVGGKGVDDVPASTHGFNRVESGVNAFFHNRFVLSIRGPNWLANGEPSKQAYSFFSASGSSGSTGTSSNRPWKNASNSVSLAAFSFSRVSLIF